MSLLRGSDSESDLEAPPRKIARPDVGPLSAARRLRSSCPATDLLKCVICQKEKTHPKNRRKKEGLHRCTWECTPATFVNAARIRADERVLIEIDGADLHAKDVLYHPSCYKDYTSTKALERLARKQVDEEEDNDGRQRRAFLRLAQDVEETILLDKSSVTNLSQLSATYNTYLSDEGLEAEPCRGDFLKARLKQHFGDRLSFHRPFRRNQAQFVFASDVEPGPLIELCLKLTEKEEERLKEDDDISVEEVIDSTTFDEEEVDLDRARTVYSAASVLRQTLLDVQKSMPFPPSPMDLLEDSVEVPTAVYNFLAWLVSPDASEGHISLDVRAELPSSEVHRKVLSIGQDLLCCVSHGRVKTPKHVSLSVAVKQMTGSSQVVSLLNRFGHGVSESQLSEIDTAMAERVIEQQLHRAAFIPSNIKAGTFATLCWDNNDLREDSLSGKTTHCTNGILIQRQVQTCAPPPVEIQPRLRTRGERRKRSLAPPMETTLDYNAGKREGPQPITLTADTLQSSSGCTSRPGESDFMWLMARLLSSDSAALGQETQHAPSWTAFNALVGSDVVTRPSAVGYLPVLPSSPTELSTVFQLLQRSVAVCDQLQQDDVVVVLDQAVYAKAAEIVWKHPTTFSRVELRMGGFHIAMTFLAVIGKRFGDAGLQDILIEAGVVGSNAVQGVLSGKQYNRGLRSHKAVMEALLRMQWRAFEKSLGPEDNAVSLLMDVREALSSLRQSGFAPDKYQGMLQKPQYTALHTAFQKFSDNQKAPLTKFWLSYINMVCLLLEFIRSSREGNWALHLSSIRQMLPWMFAYDRLNYSRFMSHYWCEMMALKDTHPAAHRELSNGEFCVQRSGTSTFSQVAVDQCIEQTINRHTKVKGGIIGFSHQPGAVQKWVVNAHQRAEITEGCKAMAGLVHGSKVATHKERQASRVKHDEASVQAVLNTMAALPNPFLGEERQVLCNLSSGVVATDGVAADILNAQATGEQKFLKFYEERVTASENRVNFFDRLPMQKLKTFSSMVKTKSIKVSRKEVVVGADSKLFARLLVVAQVRAMDIKAVLRHELGPLPWSLATADGSLCKTTKAKLLSLLEDEVPPAEEVPPNATWIVDGMAILQGISSAPATFADLATTVFNIATGSFSSGTMRADFVVDQYPDVSIKGCERASRAALGTLKVNIMNRLQKCPKQWKKYLAVGSNKENLQRFLCAEWQRPEYAVRLHGRFFYVASGTTCTRLTSPDGEVVVAEEVAALCCSHEEADTRLLLHAAHAARTGSADIVIRSPDTDVAVLACAKSSDIQARLFFRTGTKARSRYISIDAIARKEGPSVCGSLLGLHSLTGCDTTSAFKRRGKAQGLNIVRSSADVAAGLSLLGKCFDVSDDLLQVCESFVCRLYGSQTCSNINELRYNLFAAKAAQGEQLPPTRDALKLHVSRANYQAGVWFRSLEAFPDIPSPVDHGWCMQEGRLRVNWMDQAPAPEQLIVLVQCHCNKGCENAHCSCVRSGLQCTDACTCVDCSNGKDEDDASDSELVRDIENDSGEECDT